MQKDCWIFELLRSKHTPWVSEEGRAMRCFLAFSLCLAFASIFACIHQSPFNVSCSPHTTVRLGVCTTCCQVDFTLVFRSLLVPTAHRLAFGTANFCFVSAVFGTTDNFGRVPVFTDFPPFTNCKEVYDFRLQIFLLSYSDQCVKK